MNCTQYCWAESVLNDKICECEWAMKGVWSRDNKRLVAGVCEGERVWYMVWNRVGAVSHNYHNNGAWYSVK